MKKMIGIMTVVLVCMAMSGCGSSTNKSSPQKDSSEPTYKRQTGNEKEAEVISEGEANQAEPDTDASGSDMIDGNTEQTPQD